MRFERARTIAVARVAGAFALIAALVGVWNTPLARAATITVCEGAGCDHTTVQAAIQAAQSGDTISVLDAVHTEGGIVVNKNVTIVGSGASSTIIQAAEAEGDAGNRVFRIQASVLVTIRDVTIRYGKVVGAPGRGGGILNSGTLKLERVLVTANRAEGSEGAPGGMAQGGGVYNAGVLEIVQSTLCDNTAEGGPGASSGDKGGEAQGGGLFGSSGGNVALFNSTISDNLAQGGAGKG